MKITINPSVSTTISNLMQSYRPKAAGEVAAELIAVINGLDNKSSYDLFHGTLAVLCGFIRSQAKEEHQLGLAFTVASMLVGQFEGVVELEIGLEEVEFSGKAN